MRSRDARDVTSAPCALSKLRSREKKGETSRRRGLERCCSPAIETRRGKNWDEVRLGKGEGRGVTETRFTDRPSVPSVKRNSILRNGGFQGLNVYGEEGLTSLSIEFRTRGEKDLK